MSHTFHLGTTCVLSENIILVGYTVRLNTTCVCLHFKSKFQVGVLNVVEAPDILYNETSNDTIVAEGASVSLR